MKKLLNDIKTGPLSIKVAGVYVFVMTISVLFTFVWCMFELVFTLPKDVLMVMAIMLLLLGYVIANLTIEDYRKRNYKD